MDIKDKINRNKDITNVAKHLLEKHGICSFGMLLTEEDKKLGYCYQKDGSFVFVNDGGEEMKRPLMDESERWLYDLHPIKLLQYNEYKMTYHICNSSCKEYSSIYNKDGDIFYYIICPDSKSIPIEDLRNGYFEYINCPRFLILTYHDYDKPKDKEIMDNRYESYYLPHDIFFNKNSYEVFFNVSIINYKTYKIVSGVAPYHTIVFDENIEELYRKDESAVFCIIGQYAYLIFEKSNCSYNIDKQIEKELEGLEEYDNYEVDLDYLIRYSITSYAKEKIIREDERYGQYEECIPKHDVTHAIIYNSSLEVVRELHLPGVYDDIVRKEEKVLLKCSVEGKYSSDYYYDINRQKYVKYDAITRKTYSVADLVEKQISDNIIIEEVLNYSKANDYASLSFEQVEFDDEDEVFDCRIKIRSGKDWNYLNKEVYSSIVPHCFKYRGVAMWPIYLLALRNRERHEYDLYENETKLVDKGKYSNEAIKVCEEGCRIIYSDKEKFGVIGDGKILVPLIYDSIDYYHDYEYDMSIFIIQNGDKYGIIDNDGNILLQCEYSIIECYYDRYDNLYILLSSDNKSYSWACCDKESFFIDGIAFPDENSIIRPSWDGREIDGDNEIRVQVYYNIQTGEFGEDEDRFNYI